MAGAHQLAISFLNNGNAGGAEITEDSDGNITIEVYADTATRGRITLKVGDAVVPLNLAAYTAQELIRANPPPC